MAADALLSPCPAAARLRASYALFTERLTALLCRPGFPAAQLAALGTVAELARREQPRVLANRRLCAALSSALCSPGFGAELLSALEVRLLPCPDVSFYAHQTVAALCDRLADARAGAGGGGAGRGSRARDEVVRRCYALLAATPPPGRPGDAPRPSWCGWAPPDSDPGPVPGSPRWAEAGAQRRAFSAAWLALLRLPLPLDVYKAALPGLHSVVLPHLSSPVLLADFLTGALRLGALLGMLALRSLYTLMAHHGLEYPAFYTRLYGLLEPGVFSAAERGPFFGLLDTFLGSTHLPAFLAAAFAKRLARLALAGPPHGALLACCFTHNLVRRHPACAVLLHRPHPPPGLCAATDPFLASEPEPGRCRALESSLWELGALRWHYAAPVGRFLLVLDRDTHDKRRFAELDAAALATASYASLFDDEAGRRLKAVPLAFYQPGEEPATLWGSLPGWATPQTHSGHVNDAA